MAYIRTCVHNLGEIRRPVRNNCPSSLIIDEDIGPGRDDLSSQWTCGVRICLNCLTTMRWVYKNNKNYIYIYIFKK